MSTRDEAVWEVGLRLTAKAEDNDHGTPPRGHGKARRPDVSLEIRGAAGELLGSFRYS
jgi:hypothetical protein